VKPWPTGNVTLLGDAIHHMPPVGGMLTRGFGAVSASRRYLTLAISRNPALRLTALGFFRLCGAVPPLGHAVFAG
jgi:hypothetical protein